MTVLGEHTEAGVFTATYGIAFTVPVNATFTVVAPVEAIVIFPFVAPAVAVDVKRTYIVVALTTPPV